MNRAQKIASFTRLRDYQGKTANPLSILLAMYVQQSPVTKQFLCEMLDSSFNTISRHINRLEREGSVIRNDYRHWSLPNGQLPLPGLETLYSPVAPHKLSPRRPELTAGSDAGPHVSSVAPHSRTETGHRDDVCIEHAEICAQDGDVRILGPPVPSSPPGDPRNFKLKFETSKFEVSPTTTTNTVDSEEEVVVVGNAETSKFEVSAALAAAFQEVGIGRNVWAELAGCAWVTTEYVRALAARVRDHPDPAKRNPGFLVHCIRSHDPAPEVCQVCGGLDGQHRANCRKNYRRYLDGQYSDQIEY